MKFKIRLIHLKAVLFSQEHFFLSFVHLLTVMTDITAAGLLVCCHFKTSHTWCGSHAHAVSHNSL